MRHDDKYWLDIIFYQIAEMLFYSAIIMKNKKIDTNQSAVIYLKNVNGLNIRTVEHFQRFSFSFPKNDPEPFIAEFNPESTWKEFGLVLKQIYQELYREVAFDVPEVETGRRLHELIKTTFYVYSNHDYTGVHSHIFLKAINIEDFGFINKDSK